MLTFRYGPVLVLISLTIMFLSSCQFRSKEPQTLKDLNVSILATQMRLIEPPSVTPTPVPPPPTPTPAPPPRPPSPATGAKTGGPASPAPPAAPSPPAKPAATPAKPAAPPGGPPPGPPLTISLTISFKIDNPNDVEVKIQQLNYAVNGAGLPIPVKMGQLFVVDSKIPPRSSIIREDIIEITRAGPYVAMWELIKQVDKWSVNGVALVVQEGFTHPFAASK